MGSVVAVWGWGRAAARAAVVRRLRNCILAVLFFVCDRCVVILFLLLDCCWNVVVDADGKNQQILCRRIYICPSPPTTDGRKL